jgi:hypothetical protein
MKLFLIIASNGYVLNNLKKFLPLALQQKSPQSTLPKKFIPFIIKMNFILTLISKQKVLIVPESLVI